MVPRLECTLAGVIESNFGNARPSSFKLRQTAATKLATPNMQLAHSLLTLILLATTVASTPAALRVNNDPEYLLQLDSDGYNLNLQDLRLVQMAPDTEPVWMTELEKVLTFLLLWPLSNTWKIEAKAAGMNFMDMYAYMRVRFVTTHESLALRPRISVPSLQ